MEILPHREPFLFVDRIVEVEYGKRAVGVIDDVSRYEPQFQGHFPGYIVMPGAIILEALAEVGAVAALGLPENKGKIAMLAGIEHWRFRYPARPGKPIFLEATLERVRGRYGRGHVRAMSEDKIVAEGELSFVILDKPSEMSESI